jgi:hypothetical protein
MDKVCSIVSNSTLPLRLWMEALKIVEILDGGAQDYCTHN